MRHWSLILEIDEQLRRAERAHATSPGPESFKKLTLAYHRAGKHGGHLKELGAAYQQAHNKWEKSFRSSDAPEHKRKMERSAGALRKAARLYSDYSGERVYPHTALDPKHSESDSHLIKHISRIVDEHSSYSWRPGDSLHIHMQHLFNDKAGDMQRAVKHHFPNATIHIQRSQHPNPSAMSWHDPQTYTATTLTVNPRGQ